MCLYTTLPNTPLIAAEDIIVYKVMDKTITGRLLSIFRQMEYVIGEEYEAALKYFDSDDTDYYRREQGFIGRIEQGLHSYSRWNSILRQFIDDPYGNAAVIECVVPKGAEYYHGIFGSNYSIASNKLRAVRILGKDDVPQNF